MNFHRKDRVVDLVKCFIETSLVEFVDRQIILFSRMLWFLFFLFFWDIVHLGDARFCNNVFL